MSGKLIILNGPSCVGKTTLAVTFQNTVSETYYRLSIDDYLCMVPESKLYLGDGINIRNAIHFMHSSIRLLLEEEINVIVDMIYLQKYGTESVVDECRNFFKNYDVMMIKLKCELKELKRRAEIRKNRDFNDIQRQIAMQFPDEAFDVVLDTFQYNVEECVDFIINAMNDWKRFNAIHTFKID